VQLIDARQFYVKMKKSLGNKRNKIGDPVDDPREPDQIAEISRIHGNFRDSETRNFGTEGKQKGLVVSRIFDNADLGFHKISVERPLRLNFQATEDRIARLGEEATFKNLASSNKKAEKARLEEIALGHQRQEQIRDLLRAFGTAHGETLYKDRREFIIQLREIDRQNDVRLGSAEIKAILAALGERDENADVCLDKEGKPEPDPDLRDTESVPLKESIEDYFKREVLPHVPDAWIDHTKTKVGYEIPLNRYFYRYEPPRPLDQIEEDIKTLEGEILALLKEVTA
jgi:type I restriction enzyme M protein